MVRKLIRQMLAAQIVSAATVSLCLLVDNIMTGQFLGDRALTAYGLSNPVLLVIGAIGSLLAAGIQVACSRSLGRGSQEETNAGFSTAVALAAGISLTFAAAVLLLRGPLATAMGAGREGEVYEMTRDYLAGFCLGAPASMGALVLVPFLQMAGQSRLLIAAVLTMTVADIALDLLNVLVLKWGMFGMGLASSLSYLFALVIGGRYFLSAKSVFRFSRRLVTGRKIRELFAGGIPAGVNMAAGVVAVFLLNRILQKSGGSAAVAAFTVVQSIGNTSNCITTGIGGVSLTLAGVLYNEEDLNGLKELIGRLFRASAVLGLAVGAGLLLFAPALASIFLPEEGTTRNMAVLGIRLFAAGLIPCCMNNALKNMYQATGRSTLTMLMSAVEVAVFPVLAAFAGSRFMGTDGVWLYFAVSEVLTLLLTVVLILYRTGTMPWRDGAWLLPGKAFTPPGDNLLEMDIRTVEEVAEASARAERFCLDRGQSARTAGRIALCVEEMAGNTILHGFTRSGKQNHLLVRILKKEDCWIIRFRDDCGAFDPVHYIPGEGKDNLGIRLALGIAAEVGYTFSMNLNNLMLKLPADPREPEGSRGA